MHEKSDLRAPNVDDALHPAGSPKTLLVISHYDQRPVRHLTALLKSIVDHDAGSAFDVCVVVNQESGQPIELPNLTIAITVLYRPNVGMNIGSWDHGWRENAGYDYYVFLQDECIIRRKDWLEGLIQRLKTPGIGMVGECVNYRWSRPWTELTAENGSMSSVFAKRARFCLEFMRNRNILAGETGRHLRSLVWGFSRETLQALGGFPLGNDYDECIAAEIAVSRQVENLGLSIAQAHRFPFYFVVHSQWINTYPGFSASLPYEDWVRKQFAEPSFPFLPFVGKGDRASRLDQLVKRVVTERGLFESGVMAAPREGFVALLIVFIESAALGWDLLLTTLTWCLQSAPFIDIQLVAKDKFLLDSTREWMGRPENDQFSKMQLMELSEWVQADLKPYKFLLFGRPGDQFHPSLATTLALLTSSEEPDVVVWNELRSRQAGLGSWLYHQPNLEPFTISTSAHIGLAFAVRPNRVKEFPHDFADDLLHNNCHLFHIWLSQRAKTRWITHPEFLTSRIPTEMEMNPVEPSSQSLDTYRTIYRDILGSSAIYEVYPDRNGEQGCPLVPVRKAGSLSVIVSFRDRPQETISCLYSLFKQHLTGHLEVILINNLSSEESLSQVKVAMRTLCQEGADIRFMDYESSFNHSRQTNLGVKMSSGDVLFFLNNDAELLDEGVLNEMSAWALVPGIGTVGCQILGDQSQLLCAGIRLRPNVHGWHASPVEESREIPNHDRIKEVFANTFACAAISRSNFDKVGWLNETEFPNGYNDVEYCLRVKQHGLVNLYLGHLHVKHSPGTSRGRCDESFQKILLRRRYPDMSADSLFQLSSEWRADEPVRSNGASNEAGKGELGHDVKGQLTEPPVGMKQALRTLNKAMIWWVQRRILS